MANFKLSKTARLAFKQKISVGNNKPPTFEIKQEIKTENDVQVLQPNLNLVKQESIKEELSDELPASRFESDPKHDITSLVSESKTKFPETSNSIEPQEQTPSNSVFITKPTQQAKKNFKSKSKYFSQRRTSTLATAYRIQRNLSSRDPYSLTRGELDSLNWAESFIRERNSRRISNQHAPIIEIPDECNGTDNSVLNEAFMHDETISIPDTFQLAIVDFASPGGRYSLANARLIEQTLSKAVINYILENPNGKHPIFGKSIYFDGVLVLDCKDQVAYDFAKLILWDIKLWDGSKLKMLEPRRTPFDSIGSLHAPDVGIDKDKVLDVLQAQNPSVNMLDWKMLGETSFKCGYKQYSIKMSNPPVYFQRHKQLRLFYGGSEVILKLFGCEWLWNCKV